MYEKRTANKRVTLLRGAMSDTKDVTRAPGI